MTTNTVEALLFDLGGVVIEIDFDRVFARWAEHSGCDPSRFRARFPDGTGYEHHERGEIDADRFFANLRSSFGIDIPDAQLLDGWNALFVGEVPGMASLLAGAARQFPLYAFTNTNRAHEQRWSKRFSGALRHFRDIYVSSTIGLRKPDGEAFDYVVRAIGVPAGRILFFDDSITNIEGARARGLQAVRVGSVADVESALAGLQAT
ncbi:MAG TPA: HAD family phosphatase [Xanthobacteraceae bacterium]|nr:HAD family phosphatase [Xanthobacteraceae bacterium]